MPIYDTYPSSKNAEGRDLCLTLSTQGTRKPDAVIADPTVRGVVADKRLLGQTTCYRHFSFFHNNNNNKFLVRYLFYSVAICRHSTVFLAVTRFYQRFNSSKKMYYYKLQNHSIPSNLKFPISILLQIVQILSLYLIPLE